MADNKGWCKCEVYARQKMSCAAHQYLSPAAFINTRLHQRQILHADPHAKSDADEGYWVETFSIYINQQHLREFYTKKIYHGNARFDHSY